MNSEQKRAVLAIVLSGLIIFGWQYFFGKQIETPSIKNESTTVIDSQDNKEQVEKIVSKKLDENLINNTQISMINLFNNEFNYSINSKLDIVDANSKKFKNSMNEIFENKLSSLELNFGDGFKSLNVNFVKISDSKYEFNTSMIVGSLELLENGKVQYIINSDSNFTHRFVMQHTELMTENAKERLYSQYTDELDTFSVGSEEKGDKNLEWFGVDFNYYLLANIVNQKSYVFNAKESGLIIYTNNESLNQLNFKSIFVKKEYDQLASLGDKLQQSVDFGFFGILASPILRGLQYFYSIFKNYGIAIIILTIIIRLLTFPLQYKSYKSMKKMQVIQPELAKIKEKFKDQPQQLQQETMRLFKKSGANPIGGCLPMILQMPIFFAFYQVLYNAVELVDAPFAMWINDLSSKDPYYVLPILMAVSMFFHQKLTPTATMDPTQKKIMMFMPVIFALFMKDFPAGLTLYILVSTVFGMAQQLFVYRQISA